jgi:hypothetical protein
MAVDTLLCAGRECALQGGASLYVGFALRGAHVRKSAWPDEGAQGTNASPQARRTSPSLSPWPDTSTYGCGWFATGLGIGMLDQSELFINGGQIAGCLPSIDV